MRVMNGVILLGLMISGCVSETRTAPPVDVKTFTDNADNCIHFSGEWDSNLPKERQIEIEKSVDNYCGKAKEQKEKLKVKYKNNAEVEKILSGYDFS
ncbi:hypothetical protein [Pseudomonas graminis]